DAAGQFETLAQPPIAYGTGESAVAFAASAAGDVVCVLTAGADPHLYVYQRDASSGKLTRVNSLTLQGSPQYTGGMRVLPGGNIALYGNSQRVQTYSYNSSNNLLTF